MSRTSLDQTHWLGSKLGLRSVIGNFKVFEWCQAFSAQGENMHTGAPSTRAFMPVLSSNGECTHVHMTAVDADAIDLNSLQLS